MWIFIHLYKDPFHLNPQTPVHRNPSKEVAIINSPLPLPAPEEIVISDDEEMRSAQEEEDEAMARSLQVRNLVHLQNDDSPERDLHAAPFCVPPQAQFDHEESRSRHLHHHHQLHFRSPHTVRLSPPIRSVYVGVGSDVHWFCAVPALHGAQLDASSSRRCFSAGRP